MPPLTAEQHGVQQSLQGGRGALRTSTAGAPWGPGLVFSAGAAASGLEARLPGPCDARRPNWSEPETRVSRAAAAGQAAVSEAAAPGRL